MTATIVNIHKPAQPLLLEAFLESIERRAYRTALLTTKKAADALDIVQDAMLQLVQHYADKDADVWPLLFQRILQNKIMDWHRQQTRQGRWFWSIPVAVEEDEEDPLQQIENEHEDDPLNLVARARDINRVLVALESMPLRQRQAFILRAWEGLDVASTATAMGCSEGSVKTHYFRALEYLRRALSEG
jgi:RNA polymerase sigma-70 factor (ECF subfamily)